MSVHDPQMVAAFAGDGDTRLVYARHKANPTGERFFLAQGRGGEPGLREYVVEHLECPMPECGDRRLSLVHRSASVRPKRDGFQHHRGAGGHSPESIWHLAGKEVIARWVAARRPNTKVELEARLGDGDRVADVLMSWPVRRLAVEVQYSALSLAQWRARHDWYAARDIPDVWVFGHVGPHSQIVRAAFGDEPPVYRFSDLHRAMVETFTAEQRRHSLYWLNPEARLIGVPYVRRRLPGRNGFWDTLPTPDDALFCLAVEPLPERFVLDAFLGIMTPLYRVIEQNTLAYEAEKKAVEAEQEAKARAEAEGRAAAARRKAEKEAARRADLRRRAEAASRVASADRMPRMGRGGRRDDPSSTPPGTPVCRTCGVRIAAEFAHRGYHFGCEPPGHQRPTPAAPEPPEQDSLF